MIMQRYICALRIALSLVLLSVTATPLWAVTITWVNTSGGNWNGAANWNPAQVPGAGDTAQITTPGTYTVIVNDTESVGTLTIGPATGASTLLVESGGALNDAGGTISVTGSLMVAAGGVLNLASYFS